MKQIILTALVILIISNVCHAQHIQKEYKISAYYSKPTSSDKVHQIMFSETENELNDEKSKPGSGAIAIGIGVIGVGILMFARGKRINNESNVFLFNTEGWGFMGLGLALIPIGATTIVVGIGKNSKMSKTSILSQNLLGTSQSIYDYNKRDVKLGLGLTSNGIGLLVSF